MSGDGYLKEDDDCIAKMRGLPWSATVEEIMKFFGDSRILGGKNGIHLTTSREGRPSGEAFVEFETDDDLQAALAKDREHMGSRYIEVFKVNRAEMDWVIKRSGAATGLNEDGCVRLRGLPFGCSKEEIAMFFTGLEIVPNGITLLTDYSGRSSGEAYVQFINREVAERALQKHREKIGHRYIEIFRSSLSEINNALGYSNNRRSGSSIYGSRPSPYDRGDRFSSNNRMPMRGSRSFKDFNSYDRPGPWGPSAAATNGGGGGTGGTGLRALPSLMGSRSPYDDSANQWGAEPRGPPSAHSHCVHMRGLPFRASEEDIVEFFRPICPVTIKLLQDGMGRASGEADVEFATHEDAIKAMSKDKSHMQHRYIELFMNSAGHNVGGGVGGPGRRRM